MGPPSGVELSVIETVRHNQDGRLELVCSASGGNFWHTWQSSPSASGWSGQWDNFQQPPGGTAQGFDMRLDADGQLEGITWGTDFFTYQIRQSAPNNGWTGWNVINRDVSVFSSAELVVGQNQDKHLEAFTHGSGDTIYHISQIR